MGVRTQRRKNPTLALILSGILPGLGQFYNNQVLKGILFLGLIILICVLAYKPFIYLISSWRSMLDMTFDLSRLYILLIYAAAANVVLALAMLDAKVSADRINAESDDK